MSAVINLYPQVNSDTQIVLWDPEHSPVRLYESDPCGY